MNFTLKKIEAHKTLEDRYKKKYVLASNTKQELKKKQFLFRI